MESPNQRTKSYFLSDAHLGARYIADPRQHERRVVDMLRMMAADAKAVYLLGDMIDFWFEYRYVIPKGCTRFLGQLAAMTDAGIRVYWFKGNHDMWTTDYLERELGVTVVGSRMIADIDGFGRIPEDPDNLVQQFRTFCSPMAGNIQWVFYRPARKSSSREILVNVLLNGQNASVGDLERVEGNLYRWTDLKAYMGSRIDSLVFRDER